MRTEKVKKIRQKDVKSTIKKIGKKAKGITLISLVITIIILLILAGVTLSLTLGDNGIITQAQKAKEAQEIAAIKEDFQLAILDKELEKGGAGLTQEELEEIAGNYGELQEDGNTIKTEEGYEIKIDEIYQPGGGTSNPGSGASDEELAALEEKIKELEQTVEDLTNTKTELEGTIEDLNGQLEEEQGNNAELQEKLESLTSQVESLTQVKEQLEQTKSDLETQIADLKSKQATGNATEEQVLTGRTFSNSTGVGLKGSMPNLTSSSKITHTSSNTTKVILGDAAFATTNSDGVARFEIRYNGQNGYITPNTLFALDYSKVASAIGLTGNKIVAGNTILGVAGTDKGYNAGVTAADNRANPNSTNYKTGYNAGYSAGVTAGTNTSGLKTKTGSVGTTSSSGWNMSFWGRNETWTCTIININPGFTPYMAVAIADTYRHISVYSRDAGFIWMYHRDASNNGGAVYRFTPKSATSSSLQMPVADEGYTYQYWVVGK